MSSVSTGPGRSAPRLLPAALLALVVLLAVAGAAEARPYYWIVNEHSGQVLIPQNHSKANGTPDSVPGRYLLQQGCRTNTYAHDWYAYLWERRKHVIGPREGADA